MNIEVVTFVLLMHLVVPSIVKTEMCTCPTYGILSNYSESVFTVNSCLREALQAELTSTSANIQKLQNLYFSNNVISYFNNVKSTFIHTNMTVSVSSSSESLPEHNSSILFFNWTDRWYEDNLAGVITELIQTDVGLASILLLDPVTVISLRTSDLLAQKGFFQLNIELNCTSRGGPKQVDEKWLRFIWRGILQWSKAYARAGGPVPAPSDSDKGQVFSIDFSDTTFSSTCLAIHIILNLVVGIILVAFVPSQINKNISSATSSLFWSSAIIGAPLSLIFIALKLILAILYSTDALHNINAFFVYGIDIYSIDSKRNTTDFDIYVSITCLLSLLTIELIVATLRSKHSIPVPRWMGYSCSFFFICFFICCCRPGGRSHSRVARALSLWFVMASFQLIATSVVPVFIVVLIDPLRTLALLAMVVSTFFGMVIFLAVLVYMCRQHDRSKCCILFIYSVILVGVFTMVCLAIFLFLVITERGAQVNVGGFIGTLVASAILSIITFVVKKKVLGKKPTEADQQSEQLQEVLDEETQGENPLQPLLEDA